MTRCIQVVYNVQIVPLSLALTNIKLGKKSKVQNILEPHH